MSNNAIVRQCKVKFQHDEGEVYKSQQVTAAVPVLIVALAWQRADITQVSCPRTSADTDGGGPGQVADIQQGKGIQVVQILLFCEVYCDALVGIFASTYKAKLVNAMRQ